MESPPRTAGPAYSPPPAVIRTSLAVAAVGYLITAALDEWGVASPAADRWTEWAAACLLAVAFVQCRRWPTAAAAAGLSVVAAELLASAAVGDASAKIFVPTLVAASGLMLGERAAVVAGVTLGGAAVLTELVAEPRLAVPMEERLRGVAMLGLAAAATTVLTRSAIRAYVHSLADSDRSRRRFADLFRNAPEALLALDAEGRVLDANTRAEELLGPAPLLGRSLEELFRSGGGARTDRPIVEGTTKDPVRIELGGGPRVRTLEASARRNQDEDGSGRAFLVMLRDTTERRALEEQLLHAQRLETVGLLAGAVAHDFNNILTVIGGNAGELAEEGPEGTREVAREILEAQRRGTALTRQLLAFARREPHRPERVDLVAAVNGMERLLRRLLGDRNPLVLHLQGPVPVMADLSQVEQVVVNLVTNARDASPPGAPVTVSVEVARGPSSFAAGRTALIAVSDRGEGMSAEVRAHMFEPFFTTKSREKGTGLGLSTVHGIVTQSGGALEVETAPGQGTTVKVLLPSKDDGVVAGPIGAGPGAQPP